MIKETELVTLNGNTTAFGGRIYNANYQIGFNESASSVRLSIINENGSYNISENDLSVLGSPDTLAFGGRELKMFPIEYSIDKSDGGKILSVEYVDASVVYLDKKFVVLNGTHIASKSNGPNDALVTVGQKYYSEEEDAGDGVYVQNLTTTPPNVTDLGQSLYYVSELYNQMVAHNIPMHGSVANVLLNKNGATSYLNNIVGTLRNALLAWGNIMAFAFYWGEDNKLHLIDLESNIGVDLDKLDGIIPFSDEESYSLKDTVDRGYSLYYGKEGSIETEVIPEGPTGDTTITFERGIRDLNNSSITGVNFSNALPFIKASLIGEEFFQLYSLYISYTNTSFSTFLGYTDINQLTDEQRKFVDPQGEYPSSEWGFIKYTQAEEIKYNYGFFRNLAERLLTYEDSMNENIFKKFSAWSRPFQYDIENETEFLDPANGSASLSSNIHRAFFEISPEEAFDLTQAQDIPSELSNSINFESSFGQPLSQYNIDFKNEQILAYRLGVDYADIVSKVDYKYQNKVFLRNYGFLPEQGDGTRLNVTPRKENIFIKKPSFQSNTIATDMQIDSTDDNEVILAGRSFSNIASILNESYVRDSKSFRKSFSVTGITLPQNITPEDGLQSISISNSNERGTTSTYTIGNTFFKIPSKDIILQKMEREKFAELRAQPFRGFNISFRYF
jgi:hypothetical protein